MSTEGNPGLVNFDAEAAFEAAKQEAEGPIYSFITYTTEDFELLYVHDGLRAMYRDEEQMLDHFETVHSYVHIDFTEQQLFEAELFPGVGEVQSLSTRMEDMAFIRILQDRQGIFLAVEPDEPLTKLIDAIEEQL